MIEPIPAALKAVYEIVDRYKYYNNGIVTPPLRILGRYGLLDIFTQETGIEITVAVLPWQAQTVCGCMLRFGKNNRVKRAELCISESLDAEWSRFIIAKELVHLMLDEPVEVAPGEAPPSPVQTARDIMESPLFAKSGSGHPEYLFHMAALELLVPWRKRLTLSDVHLGFRPHRRLADHFGVPEKLIKLRQNKHYKKMLTRHYTDLDLMRLPTGELKAASWFKRLFRPLLG